VKRYTCSILYYRNDFEKIKLLSVRAVYVMELAKQARRSLSNFMARDFK
jgi:hypothetical protein